MSASDILRIIQLAFSKYTVRLSAAYDSTPPKKYKVDKHKIIKKHKVAKHKITKKHKVDKHKITKTHHAISYEERYPNTDNGELS